MTTLTVNSGGTVAGTGSAGGSVSVLAGGTFSPGTVTSPGRLSVGSSLLLPSGTATILDLQGTTAASGYSQAVVGGALTLGGNLSVNLLAGFNPTLGAKFYVFDLTGLRTAGGAFANGTGPDGTLFADQAGNTYQINYADHDPAITGNALLNDVSLTVVGVAAGVPEPSTGALLALGAGAVALAARRRART